MIKTQIQLPDDLYRDLKRLAAAREWSLAETLRRGAEQLLQQFPGIEAGVLDDWQVPVSADCGWCGLTPDELKDELWQVAEPRLRTDQDEA
jgi:hypothetical protein